MKEDPGYYEYWPYENRPKIEWPNGAQIAFWVAPNLEFYELDPPSNPYRTPWPQPHPAVPGYSIRDWGNRVGHARQMQLLDKYGIRGSISLSSALCDHHPEIIDMCKERNWEFFSHGIYNTRYTYGMTEQQERDMIQDAMESIYKHTGQNVLDISLRRYLIQSLRLIFLQKWEQNYLEKKEEFIRVICFMMINPHQYTYAVTSALLLFPILWK